MSDFAQRVRGIGLPLDKIIVIGSGTLDVHGIRASNDIDLVVSPEIYEELSQDSSWEKGQQGRMWRSLHRDEVEVWQNWSLDDSPHPDYTDLLSVTEEIEGVRFVTLDYLYGWKKAKGRDKDLSDCRLIEEYKKEHDDGPN